MKIFNFADYCTNQNNADCSPALIKAMEEIRKADGEKTLFFPKGEYHFYKESSPVRVYHTSNTNSCDFPNKTVGFLIENQSDLTIEGDGSLFIFHGNMMAVAVVHSTNIMLNNFAWDFAVPTTVEMIVSKKGKRFTEFTVPDCFTYEVKRHCVKWFEDSPITGERYWQMKNVQKMHCVVLYDPKTENSSRLNLTQSPFFNARSIKKIGQNQIRINYWFKAPRGHLPGGVFEMCANYVRESAGAFLWESAGVVCSNVSVHYMNAFGFLVQMCDNVTFDKCSFVPREGSGKRTTSFADLIHVSGAKGLIKIKDCSFSDAHDDPINIHGTFMRVEKRLSDTSLLLRYVHRQQGGFPQYHVGDKVVFYRRDTLLGIDKEKCFTVKSVTHPGECGNSDKQSVVVFEEKLPNEISTINYVAENVTFTPRVHIDNCRFKSIPTRGILCTTRQNAVIENCTFDGMSMASIFLSNDSGEWYESGPIRDMTIRNNTFNVLKPPLNKVSNKGAILILPITRKVKKSGADTAVECVHSNITIENNLFMMEHDTVLNASRVDSLVFKNNTVKRLDTPSAESEITAFKFNDCKNVCVENNVFGENVNSSF